jgi:hypothetical protein
MEQDGKVPDLTSHVGFFTKIWGFRHGGTLNQDGEVTVARKLDIGSSTPAFIDKA